MQEQVSSLSHLIPVDVPWDSTDRRKKDNLCVWLRAVRAKTAGRSLQRIELGLQWEENEGKILLQFASKQDKWLKLITCPGIHYFIYTAIDKLFTFNFFYITVTTPQTFSVVLHVTAQKNQNYNYIHTSLFFPCPNSFPLKKANEETEKMLFASSLLCSQPWSPLLLVSKSL